MMRTYLVFGLLYATLASCETPSRPAAVATLHTTPLAPRATAADLSRTQQFLRWYLAFSERRDTSVAPLLRYVLPPAGPERQAFLAQTAKNDVSPTGYIILHERKARNYLDSLQASGYFSAGFLVRYEASLQQRRAALIAEKQTENGAVPGFEADEIFNTQDLYQLADVASLTLAPRAEQSNTLTAVYHLPVGPESFYLYTSRQARRIVIDRIVVH